MRFYAVVHVVSRHGQLASENAAKASEAGADGIFLINHGVDTEALLEVAERVHEAHPGLWTGMNLLGLQPEAAFHRLPKWVRGVWTDNAHTPAYAGDGVRVKRADEIRQARARSGWTGEYFGGVAFKYQEQPKDIGEAAMRAAEYVDVVTTSGVRTGSAPDLAKISAMRAALGPSGRLAVASGITPENVRDYLPHVTDVLVATGVSTSFKELDLGRMKQLVAAIRQGSTQ